MINTAGVTMWNTFVGAVSWNEANNAADFQFDNAFLKKGWDIAPLMMPLQEAESGKIFSFRGLNVETYDGLPGLLADSLPDKYGRQLLDAWLARQGRTPDAVTPIERLCYIGARGMGALEFKPPTKGLNNKSEHIEVGEMVQMVNEILNKKTKLKGNLTTNATHALANIIRVGTSAGGARAKAIIAYNKSTGEVRSGYIDGVNGFDYWIIKLDGITNEALGDPKGYGKIEYAYYLMAIDCGITMTECQLLTENRRAHFMTKRFDRDGNNKIHMQSLCALAHFDYNQPGLYSYEQAFQVMRKLKLPYPDMEQLFLRMVFNVVAFNHDDHAKNISFLMDNNGTWSLSPAYDVTYAHTPGNKWLKQHQMTINGKSKDITTTDILKLAREMGIKKPEEIIKRVNASVKKWKTFATQQDINASQIKAIATTHSFLKT